MRSLLLKERDVLKTSNKVLKSDGRICFGIEWFGSEEDAMERDKEVRAAGRSYNGGFFHGMSCGRDSSFDYEDKELGKLFAVTN